MRCKILKSIPELSGTTTPGKYINLLDRDAERLAISGHVEIVEELKPSAVAIKERVQKALLNKQK